MMKTFLPRFFLKIWLSFMGNNQKTEKFRIIYKSDDVAVFHQFMEFESGDKEAVMMVYEIKDGQV